MAKKRRQLLSPAVIKEPKRVTHTEHILGPCGFTLLWTHNEDNPCTVDCLVYEIVATSSDGTRYYDLGCDDTHVMEDAQLYLTAYMKWDSCEHFNFGDKGYLHLCGGGPLKKHCALLKHMYHKSFELMGKEPYCESDIWE